MPFPSEIENYKQMKEIKDYSKVYLFNIDYKYDLPKENAKDTILAIAASQLKNHSFETYQRRLIATVLKDAEARLNKLCSRNTLSVSNLSRLNIL